MAGVVFQYVVGIRPESIGDAALARRSHEDRLLYGMVELREESIPARFSGSDADKMVARQRRPADSSPAVTPEDVSLLAQALREAKRAHAVSLAELRQADVDPVQDWAVWYAEYLLGVR